MTAITSFDGVHRWLSNFTYVQVTLDGVTYNSVECAYQAAKTAPANRAPFVDCTPGQAKRLGRNVPMRPDWDKVKVQVMRDLLKQKFAYRGYAVALARTGDDELIEGNHWGDTFWGVSRGIGENQLGKLLMEIRSQL